MSDRERRWADLFRRANGGDGAAYAAFLREAAPVIGRIVAARSGGSTQEVEDTVQEVLLAVHAKRHTWREADPVTPWVYAIARYKTADAWRRRGRPSVPIEDLAEDLAAPAGMGGGGDEIAAARDLSALLGRIDGRSARIVRAIGVDGASAAEVGAAMGMTEGAVRVAYHRAVARLRRQVGAEGRGAE